MVGIHGVHPELTPGFLDLLGQFSGLLGHPFLLLGAVAITINTIAWRITIFPANDAIDKILKIIKTVPVFPNQQSRIRRNNIECFVTGFSENLDLEFKSKFPKHARKSFLRIINRVCHGEILK